MSIAPLLLAFLSVAGAPPTDSSSGAVLLNFHAEWCGPCHKVRPAVEQLIRDGYPVKRIDIDEEPDLPRRYRVEGVPAFVVVDRDGRELGRTLRTSIGERPGAVLQDGRRQGTAAADSRSHAGSRGDRRSGDDDADDDHGSDDDKTSGRIALARGDDEPSARAGLRQSQAVGDGRSHPGHRRPFDGLRIGHRHLQHARGVADSHLRTHFQNRRPQAGRRPRNFRGGS